MANDNSMLALNLLLMWRVINVSVPDFSLFYIWSEKYGTAIHILFNIFEKAGTIQYLTQRGAVKIQYVHMTVRVKDSTALNSFCVY